MRGPKREGVAGRWKYRKMRSSIISGLNFTEYV